MTLLLAALSSILFAGLHALRGSGQQWFRWVMALSAGGISYAFTGAALFASLQGLAIFAFLVQPWGRWYTLGRGERVWAGVPSAYEKAIEKVGRSSDHLCWLLSAALFTIPLIALSPGWVILPLAMVLVYELSWRVTYPGWPTIRAGELVTGAVIGLCLILLTGCANRRESNYWGNLSQGVSNVVSETDK